MTLHKISCWVPDYIEGEFLTDIDDDSVRNELPYSISRWNISQHRKEVKYTAMVSDTTLTFLKLKYDMVIEVYDN